MHTYTLYNNIVYNNNNNCYLSVTKILVHFTVSLFMFLPQIISDSVSFPNLSKCAVLISAYIITMI